MLYLQVGHGEDPGGIVQLSANPLHHVVKSPCCFRVASICSGTLSLEERIAFGIVPTLDLGVNNTR